MELPENANKEPYGNKPALNEQHDDKKKKTKHAKTCSKQYKNTVHKLSELVSKRRKTMPEGSYTAYLFKSGEDKIRKKTGEEAVELLLAKRKEDVIYESADFIYHLLVLLEELNLSWEDIEKELEKRYSAN